MDLPTEVAMTFALLALGMAMATSFRLWLMPDSKFFANSSVIALYRRIVDCSLRSKEKVPQIIVGLDCGGVILEESHGEKSTREFADGDHEFSSDDAKEVDPAIRHFLQVPMISGTIDGVTKLVDKVGSQNVYIVSKCGPYMEQKIRAWLEHKQFFSLTGVSPDNLHFVRERKDKAPLCQRLGVTHFVDNHLDVLQGMHHFGIQGILFAPQEHELNSWYDCCKAGAKHALESPFQLVWSWIDTTRTILEPSSVLSPAEVKWTNAAPDAETSQVQQAKSAVLNPPSTSSTYRIFWADSLLFKLACCWDKEESCPCKSRSLEDWAWCSP